MIDATYKLSQQAREGSDPQKLMQALIQTFNQDRDVGVPEDATWVDTWLKQYSKGAVTISHQSVPDYQDIVACVNRGHVAIGALSDYVNLQLVDGSRPYEWTDPHGLSHLVLIVGYDDATQAVVVHDPLRILDGQPADYSWSSFQAAQFYALSEVNGPSLLPASSSPLERVAVPDGWQDDGVVLTAPNGVPVVRDFRDWVLTHAWESHNWPLLPARQMESIEWSYPSVGPGERQDFRTISLGQPAGADVYQIWVGQDLLALAQQLDDCRAEIDQLKKEIDALRQQPPPEPPSSGMPPPAPPAPEPRPSAPMPPPPAPGAQPPPSAHKTQPLRHGSSRRSGGLFDLTTLFQRARRYLPLTPVERAFLKFIQGAICTAIVAAISIIYQGLSQHLDWRATLSAALAAGGAAVLLSLNKYLTARLDPALESLISGVETAMRLPTGSGAPPEQP